MDCEQDLAQFTASAAAAVDTGKELAERQAAALESAVQDLFASPDIVRYHSSLERVLVMQGHAGALSIRCSGLFLSSSDL